MQFRPTNSQVRRARRLLIAAMVLAWATQLLVTQWALGADEAAGREVRIVMRAEARVEGDAVRLDDVCHLEPVDAKLTTLDGRPLETAVLAYRPATSPADAALAAGVAEAQAADLQVGVEQVVRVLTEAGISPAQIRFQGPIRCDVYFTVAAPRSDEEVALLAWAGVAPVAAPSIAPPVQAAQVEPARVALAELLQQDLARQLGLPVETVRLTFRPGDAALVERTDIRPEQLRPERTSDLGRVTWSVLVDGRSFAISADAQAVVSRLTVTRPIDRGQVIRPEDVALNSATISRLDDRGVELSEAVGQEAARRMQVGDVVTPDRLAPRMLVERGQFITVALERNGIEIRSLARALDDGAYGQTVKVRNETTGEILHVTMTAPQAGRVVNPTH